MREARVFQLSGDVLSRTTGPDWANKENYIGKASEVRFAECGCCDCFHRVNYWGDCRNDQERFVDVPEELVTAWIEQ